MTPQRPPAGCSGGSWPQAFFTLSLLLSASQPCTAELTLLVGSDLHLGDKAAKTVEFIRDAVSEWRHEIDAVVLVGDIAHRPEDLPDALAHLTDEAVLQGLPHAITFGNHDGPPGNNHRQRRDAELQTPGGPSLSLMDATNATDGLLSAELNGVRLLLLDTGTRISTGTFTDAYDTAPVRALRRMQTEAAGARCAIAFMHTPPCEMVGAIRAEAETSATGDWFEAISASPPNRRGVWRALHKAGVRNVFMGHDHCNMGTIRTGGIDMHNLGRGGYEAYSCKRAPIAPNLLRVAVDDSCGVHITVVSAGNVRVTSPYPDTDTPLSTIRTQAPDTARFKPAANRVVLFAAAAHALAIAHAAFWLYFVS